MEKVEILDEEIWVCSPAEARKLWNEDKEDRFRLWTEEETWKALLLTPDEIKAILDKKKDPKGYIYRG